MRELREKRGYVLWEKENRKSVAFFHVSEKTQVLGEKGERAKNKRRLIEESSIL